MDHKKRNYSHKPFEGFIQEIAPDSTLRAPPPTPYLSLKEKSGSAPDIRITDILQKDKSSLKVIPNRNINHTISFHRKSILKSFFEYDGNRSTSDHNLAAGNAKLYQWIAVGQGPATSHLLHSVRQKLMNL